MFKEQKTAVKAFVLAYKWVLTGVIAAIFVLLAIFGTSKDANAQASQANCLPFEQLEEQGARVEEYPRWVGVSSMGQTGIIIMQSVKGDHFTVFRIIKDPTGIMACVIDEGNAAEVIEWPEVAKGSPA
jgi:hypothetical protein